MSRSKTPRAFETYLDSMSHLEGYLDAVRHARRLVPSVLASGIFCDNGRITVALEAVIDEGEIEAHEQRKAAIIALVKGVLSDGADRAKIVQALEDEPLDLAIHWGLAGYVLGIAVGQQLGPDAFKDGQP